MGIVDKLLRKVSFKHRFAHEVRIAEHVSSELIPLFALIGKACSFPFGSTQSDSQRRRMLGFVSAACDAMSQSIDGEPGGNGATNAALRCYSALCGPHRSMDLLQSSFQLQEARDAEFWVAADHGTVWVRALGRGDLDSSSAAAARVFGEAK